MRKLKGVSRSGLREAGAASRGEVGVSMRETRVLVRGAKSGVRCRAEFLEIGAFCGLVGAGLPSLISAATWPSGDG